MITAKVRGRIPALDRIAHVLEQRALRRLDARAARRGLRAEGWRDPARLWPLFGDD